MPDEQLDARNVCVIPAGARGFKDPSAKRQIGRLRRAYDETFGPLFGIEEPARSTLRHLERVAPRWPPGHLAARGFRKRFGVGGDGVRLTFEANVARLQAVLGNRFSVREFASAERHAYRGKPEDTLRLAVGNDTHVPVLEWARYDLGRHVGRAGPVTDVRGPTSAADEVFDFVCLFPGYFDPGTEGRPELFAGGYELDVPALARASWRHVPYIGRAPEDPRKVILTAHWRSERFGAVPEILR